VEAVAEMILPSTREEALRWLREEWGWLGLQAIRRYLSTPPRYTALLEDGRGVDLGNAETLLNQRRLRLAVFTATHHLLRWVDQRYWDDIVRIIALAAEDAEAPEAEEFDWLRGLLESYLEERKPATEDDQTNWLAHHRMELPLVRQGEILINSTNLATWAADVRGASIRPRDLALLLRRYGAEPVKVSVREHGVVRNRRYWQLPASLVPESINNMAENTSATSVSAVSASEQQALTATNPVQDDENKGCKRVSAQKTEQEKMSETSAYALTHVDNAVQDATMNVSASEKHALTALTPVQDDKSEVPYVDL
jgi:hypothetical protein